MQVGGIGNGSGNSGLDNRGVSHHTINYRIDDELHDVHKRDTAGRDVEEKTTSAYAVSFSAEGKRLAAEHMAERGVLNEGLSDAKRAETSREKPQEMSQKMTDQASTTASSTTGWDEGIWGKLRELAQRGKRLLLQIWGESKPEQNVGVSEESAEETLMSEFPEEDQAVSGESALNKEMAEMAEGMDGDEHHESQIAAAAVNVQAPVGMVSADPYFTNTSDAGKVKEPLLARIRIRFRDIAGQLTERFGGMLSGQFSADSKLGDDGQQKKQDIQEPKKTPKKLHYQEEGVVVEISSVDGGHLMDSYGRDGKYSKL